MLRIMNGNGNSMFKLIQSWFNDDPKNFYAKFQLLHHNVENRMVYQTRIGILQLKCGSGSNLISSFNFNTLMIRHSIMGYRIIIY